MTTKIQSAMMATDSVPSAAIPASAVTYPKLAAGVATQAVNASSGAVATGTTTIPADDTIPQSNEGTALAALDTTITPNSATSKLRVDVVLNVSASVAVQVIAALFRDAGAGAVDAADVNIAGTGQVGQILLTYYVAAGSTSATTFKVRFGPASAATVTVNGSAGARLFGGVMLSSMTVTEVKA